jgi:hypothetical protein
MENTKFEFYKLKVIYPPNKILNKLNIKFDTGKNFTTEESINFFRETHNLETLNFAGRNGWQIKAITNKEGGDGEIDIYYLQRNSNHSKFGKMTFREEYHESDLYKKHENQRKKIIKRQIHT